MGNSSTTTQYGSLGHPSYAVNNSAVDLVTNALNSFGC